MKPPTSLSEISCSKVMSPGLFGLVETMFVKDAVTCWGEVDVQSPVLLKGEVLKVKG